MDCLQNIDFLRYATKSSWIVALSRPTDIIRTVHYTITKLGAQKIDCSMGCMTCRTILLKLKVVWFQVLNFFARKVGQHASKLSPLTKMAFSARFSKKIAQWYHHFTMCIKLLLSENALASRWSNVVSQSPRCNNFVY